MARPPPNKLKLSIKLKEPSATDEPQNPVEGMPYASILKGYYGYAPLRFARFFGACPNLGLPRKVTERVLTSRLVGNSHRCPTPRSLTRPTSRQCGQLKGLVISGVVCTEARGLPFPHNKINRTTFSRRGYRLLRGHFGLATKGMPRKPLKGNLAWPTNSRR